MSDHVAATVALDAANVASALCRLAWRHGRHLAAWIRCTPQGEVELHVARARVYRAAPSGAGWVHVGEIEAQGQGRAALTRRLEPVLQRLRLAPANTHDEERKRASA